MERREAFDLHLTEERPVALMNAVGSDLSARGSVSTPVGGIVKRGLDVIFAATALVLLSPMMMLVALCIKLHDGGPVFFSQERLGFRGRTFGCLKFRSMVANADEVLRQLLERDPKALEEWSATHKLKDDPRCTRFGRFLRRSSLDELPQLFNILRGDMSMVGPRPIVLSETRFYGSVIAEYKSARPGLTGLWQVSGRSDTTYEERVRLDADYVQNWSMFRDFDILLRTLVVVVRSDGSY